MRHLRRHLRVFVRSESKIIASSDHLGGGVHLSLARLSPPVTAVIDASVPSSTEVKSVTWLRLSPYAAVKRRLRLVENVLNQFGRNGDCFC
jgi:hypothetical protein